MIKRTLSEADVCRIYITPAIKKAGWDSKKQVSEQFPFTKGRKIIDGKQIRHGKKRIADYILFYKPNRPVAVIEAKKSSLPIGAGMQQALDYGEALDIPFVYSSNGKGFIEHDRTKNTGQIERELKLEQFPSPEESWKRYRIWKGFDDVKEQLNLSDYHYELGGKKSRYYQTNAINRTIEAISNGQNRILYT